MFDGSPTELDFYQGERLVGAIRGRGATIVSREGAVFAERGRRHDWRLALVTIDGRRAIEYRSRLGPRGGSIDADRHRYQLSGPRFDIRGWLSREHRWLLKSEGTIVATLEASATSGFVPVNVDVSESGVLWPWATTTILLCCWLAVEFEYATAIPTG
jgi:hypothetical protein